MQGLLELNRAAFPIADDRRRSDGVVVVKLRAAHFEIIMGFTTEVRKLRNRPSPRFWMGVTKMQTKIKRSFYNKTRGKNPFLAYTNLIYIWPFLPICVLFSILVNLVRILDRPYVSLCFRSFLLFTCWILEPLFLTKCLASICYYYYWFNKRWGTFKILKDNTKLIWFPKPHYLAFLRKNVQIWFNISSSFQRKGYYQSTM